MSERQGRRGSVIAKKRIDQKHITNKQRKAASNLFRGAWGISYVSGEGSLTLYPPQEGAFVFRNKDELEQFIEALTIEGRVWCGEAESTPEEEVSSYVDLSRELTRVQLRRGSLFGKHR
ncbi:hypothetical protein AGMMS49957_01840 [Synergistales bacterium]|nr:hypothetical protein AGMMS49957_01840 [Synergistales bacterium]